MLAEVVCAEEFLRLVAFAELMDDIQMGGAGLPAGRVGKLVAAVAADVGGRIGD
jgi:hypothetical protein